MNFGAKVLGDIGLIRATSGRALTLEAEVSRLVSFHGQILNTLIKAKASGRPGPNAPTGDYRRSWTHQVSKSGPTTTSVNGTNAPQGRRLEFGFVGMDSLGRVYDQPPFPHVGPAFDEIKPRFLGSVEKIQRSI